MSAPPKQSPRRMWRPKRPELPKQCASCPFLEGNDTQFGNVLNKLRRALAPALKAKVSAADIHFARFQVRHDCKHSGDFVCHGTAYTPEMKLRLSSDHRQCPGATKFFTKL